jgi:hypothetical protein
MIRNVVQVVLLSRPGRTEGPGGWITLILGLIQLTGGFSLFGGGVYGRVIGIAGASLGALGAAGPVSSVLTAWGARHRAEAAFSAQIPGNRA